MLITFNIILVNNKHVKWHGPGDLFKDEYDMK